MKKGSEDKSSKDKSSKDKTEKPKAGLTVEKLKAEVSGALVRPNQRMWLTEDGKKLVPQGHKDAATLYCNGNNSVPLDEFESLKQVGFKD